MPLGFSPIGGGPISGGDSPTGTVALDASIACVSTATGAADISSHALDASVAAVSTATGAADISSHALDASVAAVSTATGDLTNAIAIAAAVTAVSTATSALTASIDLVASTGIPGDANYNDVVLLAHFDGTNGDTTFTDDGPNALTLSAITTAALSSAQAEFGPTSLLVPSDGGVQLPVDASLDLGTGDFTIEAWIYKTHTLSTPGVIIGAAATGAGGLFTEPASGGPATITLHDNTLAYAAAVVDTIANNTWAHVAAVVSGGAVTIYIDGVAQTNIIGGTLATAFDLSGGAVGVYLPFGAFGFDGHLDDVRVTKGVARYTTNFTPPTQAFYNNLPVSYEVVSTATADLDVVHDLLAFVTCDATASAPFLNLDSALSVGTDPDGDPWLSSVSLLAHFDGANGATATTDSGPLSTSLSMHSNAVLSTAQQKFGTASLSVPSPGDGGLQLPVSDAFTLDGDFTIEAWCYRTNSSDAVIIGLNDIPGGILAHISIGNSTGPAALILSPDIFSAGNFTFLVGSSVPIAVNTWFHVAVTREGTDVSVFVNGAKTADSPQTIADTFDFSGGAVGNIAYDWGTGTQYLDDARITKGVARYTHDFAAPTAAFPEDVQLPSAVAYASADLTIHTAAPLLGSIACVATATGAANISLHAAAAAAGCAATTTALLGVTSNTFASAAHARAHVLLADLDIKNQLIASASCFASMNLGITEATDGPVYDSLAAPPLVLFGAGGFYPVRSSALYIDDPDVVLFYSYSTAGAYTYEQDRSPDGVRFNEPTVVVAGVSSGYFANDERPQANGNGAIVQLLRTDVAGYSRIRVSNDKGLTWSTRYIASPMLSGGEFPDFNDISFAGGLYFITSGVANISSVFVQQPFYFTSSDAETWTLRIAPSCPGPVVYNDGTNQYLYTDYNDESGPAQTNARAYTSPDAAVWTEVAVPLTDALYSDVRVFADQYLAFRHDGAAPDGAHFYASPDAVDWTRYDVPVPANSHEMCAASYGGFLYIGVTPPTASFSSRPTYLMRTDDLSHWSTMDSGSKGVYSLVASQHGLNWIGFDQFSIVETSMKVYFRSFDTLTTQPAAAAAATCAATAVGNFEALDYSAIAAVSTTAAALTSQIRLAAAATCASTPTALFGIHINLAAAATAAASATGVLNAQILDATASTAVSTVADADLITSIRLAAAAASLSTASGLIPADVIPLDGALTVVSSASPDMTAAIRLVQAVVVTSTASGALTAVMHLNAAAVSLTTINGVLNAQVDLVDALTVANCAAFPTLTAHVDLAASASAVASSPISTLHVRYAIDGAALSGSIPIGDLTAAIKLASDVAAVASALYAVLNVPVDSPEIPTSYVFIPLQATTVTIVPESAAAFTQPEASTAFAA